ncbi:hypothetical protein, partial [Escherichia coli]|uniref:hypothetical protein n=1 Tax=Escherichia coli TaxID=562 RepID=UPI00207B6A77
SATPAKPYDPAIHFHAGIHQGIFKQRGKKLILCVLKSGPVLLIHFCRPRVALCFVVPELAELPGENGPGLDNLLKQPFLIVSATLLIRILPRA